MDIVIQNGRVIDPAAGINEICSVGIEGAKIVDISAGHLDGKYTINADGCIVTPGLIDFHTHLLKEEACMVFTPIACFLKGLQQQ